MTFLPMSGLPQCARPGCEKPVSSNRAQYCSHNCARSVYRKGARPTRICRLPECERPCVNPSAYYCCPDHALEAAERRSKIRDKVRQTERSRNSPKQPAAPAKKAPKRPTITERLAVDYTPSISPSEVFVTSQVSVLDPEAVEQERANYRRPWRPAKVVLRAGDSLSVVTERMLSLSDWHDCRGAE